MFTLRDMPVKEQYKRAIRQINEINNPNDKYKKPEQSMSNMILSNKGTSLDMQK